MLLHFFLSHIYNLITQNFTSFFSSLIKEEKEEEEESNKELLPPSPPPRNLDEVEAILGYKFKNKCLLEQAFTHTTYNKHFSYERLELLGDSVLNMLVTKEQFFLYQDLGPGWLTRLRAANVDSEKLARVAIKHGFHHYLRHNKPILQKQINIFMEEILEYPLHSNGLIEVPKNLADIVESIIGAVFIDCGNSFDTVWMIFKSLLEPMIDPNTLKIHPVTELYEVCDKMNKKVQFVDLWQKSRTFLVFIDNKLVGKNIHDTRKDIVQNRAAKNALDNIAKVFNSE
ncbi:putative ribonuclease III [Lupinus albus]|uniref:Putative ribonuclease III n=1 Tax=Lupinus albus TaxID=3870 RepID=A0A6A4NNE6_LUPAL|nr:putative ribonuclease III [Lupinus albus]